MGREPGKMSELPPAFPQGLTPKPGDHPDHIHGGGSEQMLEMRPCQPNVPTLPESKAPDALREATLHPRPERILGLELGGLLALARSLDRLVVRLGPDGQLPGGVSG